MSETRRRAANLFSCGGGTSVGIEMLDFDVVGVDYDRHRARRTPQPGTRPSSLT